MWVWFFSLAAIFFIHTGHNHDEVLNWDVFGYYLYLPALFIHNDLYLQHYDWLEALFNQYEISSTFYQALKWETGNWIIRYTPGMAVLYLPFFIIGHLTAGILGMPQDGLSAPYQYAIDYGVLLFPFLGLWFTRKWLKLYFHDNIVAISLIILVFGTNFLHMAADVPALTHVPLFSLYAIFLYYTEIYFIKNDRKTLFIVAASAGLIILTRPTESALLCIPFLWKINSDSTKNFFFEIRKRTMIFLPAALITGIIIFPMLIYWKIGSGSWFINSYRNPGEGLDFLDPHFRLFLLSFRKGWLIYTPLSVLMMIGIWLMFKKKEGPYAAIGIFFLLALYISASWTCWWYAGGCYSQRNMVQVYAALALPLSFCVRHIREMKQAMQWMIFAVVTTLIALNLFQHWQFRHDIIDHERMTGAAYKQAFLKTSRVPEIEAALLIDRSAGEDELKEDHSGFVIQKLRSIDFPAEEKFSNSGIPPEEKNGYVGGAKEFLDLYTAQVHEITDKYYFWIKVSAEIFIPEHYEGDSPGIVVHFEHKEGAYKYRHKVLKNENLKKGSWNELSMYYLSPEARSKKDRIKIYLWHPSPQKVRVKQLNALLLEPEEENPIP